jgi:hypothetical protein
MHDDERRRPSIDDSDTNRLALDRDQERRGAATARDQSRPIAAPRLGETPLPPRNPR